MSDADPPLELDVEETLRRLTGPETDRPRLIDCREEDEWRFCRIEGAELVPLSQFGELAPQRFTDPAEPLIVYCHHGMRSLRAAAWLRARGFGRAQSMAGGIDAWTDRIDPTVPRY